MNEPTENVSFWDKIIRRVTGPTDGNVARTEWSTRVMVLQTKSRGEGGKRTGGEKRPGHIREGKTTTYQGEKRPGQIRARKDQWNVFLKYPLCI